MAIEDRLVGSWELLERTMQAGDGPKIHPYGKDASGLILYTEARRSSNRGVQVLDTPVVEVARLKALLASPSGVIP